MGDLIIKPASSGNLKIQDQGGTERISLNTSGITTFASNTTFSGTGNNIGTATAGTIDSAVTFPSGHILRTFYDESDAAQQSFSSGTTTYWDEMDLSIPASSTSDYLIITLNLNGVQGPGSGAYLKIGLAYSTDSWSTPNQLGTVEYYDGTSYINGDLTIVTSSTVVVRVNHPTTSAYSIRPKINAVSGLMNINQFNGRSTILAMEVKG